jgi:hypothetical protein
MPIINPFLALFDKQDKSDFMGVTTRDHFLTISKLVPQAKDVISDADEEILDVWERQYNVYKELMLSNTDRWLGVAEVLLEKKGEDTMVRKERERLKQEAKFEAMFRDAQPRNLITAFQQVSEPAFPQTPISEQRSLPNLYEANAEAKQVLHDLVAFMSGNLKNPRTTKAIIKERVLKDLAHVLELL